MDKVALRKLFYDKFLKMYLDVKKDNPEYARKMYAEFCVSFPTYGGDVYDFLDNIMENSKYMWLLKEKLTDVDEHVYARIYRNYFALLYETNSIDNHGKIKHDTDVYSSNLYWKFREILDASLDNFKHLDDDTKLQNYINDVKKNYKNIISSDKQITVWLNMMGF